MIKIKEPRGVAFIKDALAKRLGRLAATRSMKSNPSDMIGYIQTKSSVRYD